MIGQTIHGNLLIKGLLGEGGMGSVYLVENIDLPDRKCAVKVLRNELTSRPDFRNRFFQEASNQARLDHPNIVNVLDYFQEKGEYFLVLTYIEGGSVGKLIEERGRLDPKQALAIFKGVLQGLDCAHKHGIIHRDIKPSNILVDHDGRARLTDFGIAIQAGAVRLTASGVAVGTAAYMSPEQILHPQDLDHRTDVYSAGVVLFEMLTGKVPFDGATDFAIKEQHVKAPPPDPRSIDRSLPAGLARIVLRALEKDPDRRYQGCAQFLSEIEAYERRQSSGADAASRRGRLMLAIGSAAAVLVGGAIFMARDHKIEEPSGPTVTPVSPNPPSTDSEPSRPSGPSTPAGPSAPSDPSTPPGSSTLPGSTDRPVPTGTPEPPNASGSSSRWTTQAEAAVSTLILTTVQASGQLCRDAAQIAIKERGRQLARENGESAFAEQFEAQIGQLNANVDELAGRYREGVSQLAAFDGELVRHALGDRAQRETATGAGRHVDFVARDYERLSRGEGGPSVQAVRERCREERARAGY